MPNGRQRVVLALAAIVGLAMLAYPPKVHHDGEYPFYFPFYQNVDTYPGQLFRFDDIIHTDRAALAKQFAYLVVGTSIVYIALGTRKFGGAKRT